MIDRKHTQRMDFVQGSSLNWMGRYSWSHDDEVTPALKLNGSKLLNTIHQLMIGNTHGVADGAQRVPLRLQLLLQHLRTRAGLRTRRRLRARHSRRDARPARRGHSAVGISGFAGFGDSTEGPYTNRNKTFEFTDNVSWIRGAHSIKLGASIRFDQYNQVGNQFSRGSFVFDGRATGSATCATPGGAAFADFLLGTMRSSESAVRSRRQLPRDQPVYFTDTWRMRGDMTLDYGLRYEYVPPWLDKGGTLINAYLPYRDTGLPVADLSRHPLWPDRRGRLLRGLRDPVRAQHPGVAGRPIGRPPRDDDKLNFAPRVGWAWTPSTNWSIRSGAGIFYMQDTGQPAVRHGATLQVAGRTSPTRCS